MNMASPVNPVYNLLPHEPYPPSAGSILPDKDIVMKAFELTKLLAAHAAGGRLYHEFLRTASMSVGLYKLAAGAVDPQSPHQQDELYYVIEGRGRIQVRDEDQAVEPGSLVFVPAQAAHRFHSITEDMTILVVFAPPEGL